MSGAPRPAKVLAQDAASAKVLDWVHDPQVGSRISAALDGSGPNVVVHGTVIMAGFEIKDAAPRRIGMWDDERSHPWRAALLYGLTIAATLLASHCAAMAGAA